MCHMVDVNVLTSARSNEYRVRYLLRNMLRSCGTGLSLVFAVELRARSRRTHVATNNKSEQQRTAKRYYRSGRAGNLATT